MPSISAKVYVYNGCDTCRKALKFLKEQAIAHEAVPIREQPPTVAELQQMLRNTGSLRRLFNTSGGDYKAMGLATKLPDLSEAEALTMLAAHGNLVKRPFLLLPDGQGTTGFKEDEWKALFEANRPGR